MNARRLYRCRQDKMLAGVASGMADFFDIDPTIVRIAWIISALFGGLSIILYVILAFVIPTEPAGYHAGVAEGAGPAGAPIAPTIAQRTERIPAEPGRFGLVVGIVLIVFGGLALVGSALPGWVAGIHLGPAFVLALGIALIVGSASRTSATASARAAAPAPFTSVVDAGAPAQADVAR